MGEIKTVYSEDQLSVTDLKRDVAKNITPPVETNVLEVKTANGWIEEAKNKPTTLHSPENIFGSRNNPIFQRFSILADCKFPPEMYKLFVRQMRNHYVRCIVFVTIVKGRSPFVYIFHLWT